MASKTVVILFAVLALAAAKQVKRQAIYGADDGSYWPGKYEGTAPYVAAPYAAAPYAAYPYAAVPYAAAPYAAYPYTAYPYAYGADDGQYFPGKYGPETQ